MIAYGDASGLAIRFDKHTWKQSQARSSIRTGQGRPCLVTRLIISCMHALDVILD